MSLKLIKNTSSYIVIGFLSQAFIFLLWIVLAWWLDPSQIGIYALVMFTIEFFSAISIFGLDSAIMRFYYSDEKVSSVFSNALVIFIAAIVLSLTLFFVTANWISSLIPGLANILVENLLLFSAIIFTNSIINFALIHYAALKKIFCYGRIQLLKVLFFCSFSFILVHSSLDILGVFFALLLSSLLPALLFIKSEAKRVSFHFISFPVIKNISSYAFPLMLKAVFGILTLYFSRILLDRYSDLSALGIYSFFLMLTLQVNGLWSSFNRAWTPEVFSKFLEDKKKALENIEFMTFFLSFIYLISLAVLIVVGESFLFKWILKEVYLANTHLFYILLLMPLFSGIYIASYPLYYYKKRTRLLLLISIVISAADLSLTFFMVKFFNQNGAAFGLFVISIFTVLIHLFAFKKIMQIPSKIINWAMILSVLMAVNVGVLLITKNSFLFLIFIISAAVLAYKMGDLSQKKHLFFDFIKKITAKLCI